MWYGGTFDVVVIGGGGAMNAATAGTASTAGAN